MAAVKSLFLPVLSILILLAASVFLAQYPVTFIDVGYLAHYGNFTYAGIFLILALSNHASGRRRAAQSILFIAILVGILMAISALPLEDYVGADENGGNGEAEEPGGGAGGALLIAALVIGFMRGIENPEMVAFFAATLGHVWLFDALLKARRWHGASYLIAGLAAGLLDAGIYFPWAYAGTGLPWVESGVYAVLITGGVILAALPVYWLGTLVWSPARKAGLT